MFFGNPIFFRPAARYGFFRSGDTAFTVPYPTGHWKGAGDMTRETGFLCGMGAGMMAGALAGSMMGKNSRKTQLAVDDITASMN